MEFHDMYFLPTIIRASAQGRWAGCYIWHSWQIHTGFRWQNIKDKTTWDI